MASRSCPAWLVGVLLAVSAGGWVLAWNLGKSAGIRTVREESGDADTASGRKPRENRPVASPASFIADPETSRLLSTFESIHAAAEPGKVNKKLVQACHAVLLDGNVVRRERNFSLLLQLMRPEDGPALHEQFLELHREGKTYDEYNTMATRWGEVDAPGAIKYLSEQVPFVLPAIDLRAIARGWGASDPVAAMDWVHANPDLNLEVDAKAAVMEGWMREDPAVALKWIERNREGMNPRDQMSAMRIALQGFINGGSTGAEDAANWLVSLPRNDAYQATALRAWDVVQPAMGEMPYEKAARIWAKVGSEDWMEFNRFAGFSGEISRNRMADRGMEGFLAALEKTWPAEQVTTQFSRWTTRNPGPTLEWLSHAPRSGVTDAAIRGAVNALESTDPAAAAEWSRKLGE